MENNRLDDFQKSYREIVNYIYKKQFDEAEKLLTDFQLENYALWNYTYALLRQEQGWMNEAYNYYKKAYELEPSNKIFADAYENIRKMRSGARFSKISSNCAIALGIGITAGCIGITNGCIGTLCCINEFFQAGCCCLADNFNMDYCGGLKMG